MLNRLTYQRKKLRLDMKLICRSKGDCVIDQKTRKRCKACRLKKCELNGMRKDWILSDEEKFEKRKKIEKNRRMRDSEEQKSNYDTSTIREDIRQSIYDDNFIMMRCKLIKYADKTRSFYRFNINDWDTLSQIQMAYYQSVQLHPVVGMPSYPFVCKLYDPLVVVNVPMNIAAIRLIAFYKSIPEFLNLCEDDKLILIKYNLLGLIIIRSVMGYNPVDDTYRDDYANDCSYTGKQAIGNSDYDLYTRYTHVILSYMGIIDNDRLILKIILILFLFSKGSALRTSGNEPILQDSRRVFHAQNVYLDILWKYYVQQWGDIHATKMFIKLIHQFMITHCLINDLQQYYYNRAVKSDELAPLMESIMHIASQE
ncbi:unnamed protein product [Didymodactylos carnosus]|uniref:Uncharacterized protein n=1 Tax=Didymodactylos carnosus TaxID=1234261 RepID=A0A814S2V5_9BILA|nr:unnamed protein product [Didymodactylos carnosus]CAF3906149.1 unnamed protein product [Didymodactylos carnosus]